MLLQDIKIILSRPSESGNIGAVCRVIKNMGLSGLRLAGVQPQDQEKIRLLAVNSWDIWEETRIFGELNEATADCAIVVGTTRRRGHNRKNISMTPRSLAAWLSERQGPAAIVFGNERTGLDEAELNLCNFASHIPVCEEPQSGTAQPSLNLSHAVQIYAYEFFLAMHEQLPVKGEWTAMNQSETNELVNSITDKLADLGFYKKPNREEQSRFLRDLISRAGLSGSEGQYFKEIIMKAGFLNNRKNI